jgi:hypothetical protein
VADVADVQTPTIMQVDLVNDLQAELVLVKAERDDFESRYYLLRDQVGDLLRRANAMRDIWDGCELAALSALNG